MFTTEHRIKWLARFFVVRIEKYITWNVRTTEEDGGAYHTLDKAADTLEEAVRLQWVEREMDKKIASVLAYRDLNYKDESDAELGIQQ
jgi:hypothetical protein